LDNELPVLLCREREGGFKKVKVGLPYMKNLRGPITRCQSAKRKFRKGRAGLATTCTQGLNEEKSSIGKPVCGKNI